MRKSVKFGLLSVALMLCIALGVKGYVLQVASGTWAAQPGLTQARSGASAVLLQDGRILVTGGDGAAGTLASAELIGTDGTSSAAAPMSMARSRHVSALLANGTVLAAGGTTIGGGAINTAEIYDPVSNSWTTLAGGMVEARSNATATVLLDGRVLIAGGDRSGVASSTIEIFDPVALTFSFAGALASPRTDHAMARLSDGRVFIAGGSNGSAALNTTDIYDPVMSSVNAGPALSALRMGHSATTMLDGRVLIAGGNNGTADLATAEIFDPVAGTITAASSLTTARQGHLAFLLPNNNTVLIAGGTSGGAPLASAEVFTPWLGTFAPTGSLTVARSNSAGSPMKQDGLLLVAGGQDASGVALGNTDLYGFATVKTDASDYPPGTTVNITGSGWQPGETVTLTLVESPFFDTHGPFAVVADANGNISNSSFTTDDHDINIRFSLTAVGAVSEAQNTFTDSKPSTVTVGAQTPNPIAPAGTAQYTVTVGFSGSPTSCTSPLSIQTPPSLPTGATASFNPTSITSTGSLTSTLTISTTNVTPPGSTTFTVLAGNGGGSCQGGTATGTGTLAVVESTTTTLTSTVNPSTFGQSTTLTATVTQTTGPTTPNAGTVTFKDGATTLGTGNLNASGVATLAVSNLTAGSHSLTASYAGTASFGASTSSAVSQTVSQASTTTTLTSGTNPSSSGQSVTFTATVAAVAPGAGTATGTVTFKDGTTTISTGTLSGGIATLMTNTLTVGSHSITAVYSGDANFTGSTSAALTQTVNQGNTTTTITAHTPSPSVVGQAVNITFTATSTGGTPTGNVTVSDGVAGDSCTATVAVGTCSITFPASGTKTLSAVYGGDANFTGSTSVNVSQVVTAAATTTAITAHTPSPSVLGQPVTVNYTVTVTAPGSGTIPGTDNVTVSDGTGDSCTGTVTAGTCQLTTTTTGNKTLTATFAGDGNFSTSTSTGVAHTVNQAPTITSANSTTFVVGTAGSFTVTATGFPTPTFTESGNLPSGVTLSTAGVLSGTPAANTGGSYSITITANNGVSPNGTQSFVLTVNQAPIITSANATSFVANAPGTFTFTATGFPTAMTFSATGTLPSGVTLSSAGVLSGTTSVTGTFPITVTASNGITPNGTQSFTLAVGQAPAFTSANNAAFSVLTAGSFTVTASGFPTPTFTTVSVLPSGVTLTSAGALSGTPASGTAGSYPLIITAHNGVGTDATQNFTLTVNKLTPVFSPALSSPAPIAFGTATVSLPPVSVMVTAGSIRASSPDTVTISINGTSSGPISFNGSSGTFGPFAFNTQTIPVGSYPITYTYSGGSNFNGISDSSTTLTVNKANQTITVTTPAPATAAFNSSFTVAATASSGLPVTYSSSGACTNVGATFTMSTGTGTCTVKFDQAGNSNYSAAPEVSETVTAQQSTATVTLSNLTQTYTGSPLTPTATTNPAGLTIGWTGAPDTNVGSYPVTAKVNDPNYQGSASGTFTITGVATTTSVSAPPVTYPANGIVTVTVSSGAGIPTGNATLVVDGGLPLSAALNASGIATFTITNPSPGTHGLSASYAAQGNFAASGPVTGSLAVSQAPVITSAASTTFTAGIAGSFPVTTMGVPFPSLSESGALPSGITFTDNGDGTATLAGTTIVAGTYPITIIAANGVGLPATQTFTLTVSAGAFTQLQVLVPGETPAPGTTNGKTGTPSLEYVNGAFNVTVNAVDANWNVVSTVSDTVHITSSDAKAVLPTDAALVSGIGTFSVTLETVANPAATTITASDITDNTKAASTSAPIEAVVAYTASISPTMAANAVATAYTLTVKNGDAPNANNLKSVTVAIPANGGVPTSVTVGATSPANWTVEPTPLQGFLRFRECTANDACYGNSNNDVQPGGTITIQFTTTASETINNAAVNEVWTTTAFSDAAYTTGLPLAGNEPTVAIATEAAITSANSTTFSNGTAGTFTVTTTGFPIPTLSESGSLPSGVTFKDNLDGTATIAGTTQVAGNSAITITAHNGFGADATQTFTLTVTKANTTTTVTSSNLSSFSGQPVTFTATVVPGNSTAPTGTVQFQDGGVNLGSAVALTGGTGGYAAQLVTSTLSVGPHSITAIYSGDANFFTSTSAAISQLVKSAITTTSISAPTITYGADGLVTVTVAAQDPAAGTPSGNVTLTVDGGTAVSQALVNGSAIFTISKPGAGDRTLNANFAAQNNFLGSYATGTLHVNQALATVMLSNLSQIYDGTAKAVNFITTPLGLNVAVTYGGSPSAPTNAGSYAIVATIMDPNYVGSTTGTLIVQQAQPVVTWSNPADITFGTALSSVQLNATAAVGATNIPGIFTYTPAAGTVLNAGDGQTLSADFAPTDSTNYAAVLGTHVLINVKAAPLYVVSSDGSRAFGQTNPTFTPTFVGLTDGDMPNTVGTVTCLSGAGATSAPGTYAAICSGVNSSNYTVTYIAGTLSVTNPLSAITAINGASSNSETLTIGQTDTLTATGAFTDSSTRKLSVAGGTSFGKTALTTPVSGAAIAEAGGVLYAIGGSDGTNVLTTIQAYNPTMGIWTVLPNNVALATPRTNAAVASSAGKIYVIGGKDASNNVLSSVEVLDTTGANPAVSPFPGSLSVGRSAAGAAVFNQKLYVIGGSNSASSALSSVDIFDLVTGNPTPGSADAGATLSQASAAVLTQNNISKLFVAGVSGSSIVLISFDGTNWSSPVSTSLDPTQGVGVTSFGGLLYLVNGASMWSYDGTAFVQKNSLGNAHNGTQPVSIGSLIYAASVRSGSASSNLDAFAPDEVKWSSADATKATVDQSGNITALAITSPGTVVITAASLSDPTITAQFQLTIIKKTQTIQFGALTAKTYGDADFGISATSVDSTSQPTGLLVGFTAGATDGCTVGTATLAGGVSNATVHISGAGSCTITASQPGDDTTWQAATSVPQTFAIAKATLTVTAANATRYYGVNNPTFTGTITGIQNGDNITATYASAATATSPVGTYPIVPTLVDPSSKLGNYNVISTNGTLTVKAVAITVTADAQTKVYGDNDPALTYKVTTGALVTGDSFTGALSRAIGESVGSYAINQGTLALSTNYSLTFVGANLAITARPITVTADAQTKVYGDNDPALTYKVTMGTLVTGDSFTGALSRAAGTSVGTYAITQGNLALSTNYSLTFVGANLVITARPITVTADAQTKMYGNNDPALTYKVTMGTLVTGDSFTGALSRAAGNSVGTYAITQGTLALSGNYALTYAGAIFTITPAPLVITASSGTMIYGGPVFPVTPLSYNVFVNGDTSASLSTAASCGTQATSASLVGTYTSFCAGAVDANYTITYMNGIVTITPAGSTTTVSSSLNTSNWGQVVIFTATVTPQFSGTPTGSVSFYNAPSGATCQSLAAANAATLDVEPLATVGSSQQVSTSNAWLPVGTDTVLACYSGDTNFVGSSGTVSQTVIAAPIAKLDPASVSFGNQQGGTISGPQTVIVSNPNGTAPLVISSIVLGGTNPNYFSLGPNNNCSSVAVGASCTITVKFTPPANTTGVATANVIVTDNDENVNGSTQTSLLTGAGTSSINSVGSLSTYGIFATANGCSSINMSGNAIVDSFNSGSGNNGNVGTNGNATLSGNPVINGAVYSPIGGTGNCSSKSLTGLSLSGRAQAAGGLVRLSGPLTYPAPPAPSPAPPTTSQNISGSCGTVAGCNNGGTKTVYLAPGLYGNVSITGGTAAHFNAGGTYNFNSLTLSGNSALVVDAGSGPVVVNLAGKSVTGGNAVLDLTGGVMSNASGQASNLQFYYAGSQPVKLSGNTASYAVVYAPNAPVNLSGGSHFYGAITGSTVNNSGGTAIHYDAGLPNISAGDYIWFNSAALNVQGLPSSGSTKVYVTNASISFPSTSSQCAGTYLAGQCTLPVPNAVVTFSSTATTPSTTWDAANSRWTTLVPTNGSTTVLTHSFINGLAYMVPAAFPAGIQNVTWSAAFSTSTPNISFSWQWGAAIYSSFSNSYPSLGVNPVDSTDPAGTPESYKGSLVFGATGPGYVGLYTGAAGVVPTIAEASVAPSSLDFTNGGTVAQSVGSTSAPLQAVLTNNMSGSLAISSVQLTGTNANDFALLTAGANSCLPLSALPAPGSLPSGASCTLYVTFTPSAISKRTAKIVVNDNANNTPQTVFLKGTGQ